MDYDRNSDLLFKGVAISCFISSCVIIVVLFEIDAGGLQLTSYQATKESIFDIVL